MAKKEEFIKCCLGDIKKTENHEAFAGVNRVGFVGAFL